jgi:hypothetical protein
VDRQKNSATERARVLFMRKSVNPGAEWGQLCARFRIAKDL